MSFDSSIRSKLLCLRYAEWIDDIDAKTLEDVGPQKSKQAPFSGCVHFYPQPQALKSWRVACLAHKSSLLSFEAMIEYIEAQNMPLHALFDLSTTSRQLGACVGFLVANLLESVARWPDCPSQRSCTISALSATKVFIISMSDVCTLGVIGRRTSGCCFLDPSLSAPQARGCTRREVYFAFVCHSQPATFI